MTLPIQIGCASMVQCSLCDQQTECREDQARHGAWLMERRMAAIGRRVLVLSNKGGVGKSTVAANLAAAMAMRGFRVGLADADLSGPSIPHMFGLAGARIRIGPGGLVPPEPLPGLKVISLGFLLSDPNAAAMWRDSFKYEFLQQILGGVDWGELDMLLVDMPPGTGGELIGVMELLGQVDGALVVTTPQEVALADVRRGIGALVDSGVPVLGIIENMAGLACPHCGGEIHPFRRGGGESLAAAFGLPLLGQLPLDPAAVDLADAGRPVVVAAPESPVAGALSQVAEQVLSALRVQDGHGEDATARQLR